MVQALRRRNERGGGWLTPPHTGDKRSATTDCKRQIDATFGDTFFRLLENYKSIQALRRRNERGGGWLTPPHTGDKSSATTESKRQIDATFGDTFLDFLKTINPFRPSEGEMTEEEDELPHPTQGKKGQQPQTVSIK